MDLNAPPPLDGELPALVSALEQRSRTGTLDVRRAAFEGIYELAYKLGPKVASAVPTLIDGLSDIDPKIGDSAVWALRYCSPDSIAPLTECLSHPQALVRERAAHSLGNIGDAARLAVPRLLRLLDDEDQAVRKRAAWAIGLTRDTEPATVDALARKVSQGTSADKAAALHALGNIGQALENSTVLAIHKPLILTDLANEDSDVRWSALFAVKSLDLAPATEAGLLFTLMQHEESDRVIEAGLSRLKQLAPVADLSGLMPSITRCLFGRGRQGALACEVLSAMLPAPRDAIQPLMKALELNELALAAAQVLWKLDGPSDIVLRAVERVFDDNAESACDLICDLGPAAAPLLPKLIDALSGDNWDLQWAAADALGAVASPDPHVIEPLLHALGHPSPIVRSASARALSKTGAATVHQLRRLLRDSAETPSTWAAYALGEMGPSAAEALPDLIAGMHGDRLSVSDCCAIAIAHVSADASVVPYLIAILQSEELGRPRRAAASALGQLGPSAQDAISALETLVGDDDYEVHQAAEDALTAIQSPAH